MDLVEVVSKRKNSGRYSGRYNPLKDNELSVADLDTWTCVALDDVPYKDHSSLICRPGTQIRGWKYGDWLKVQDSGLLLPMNNKWGERNFKNERCLIMEQARGWGQDSIVRIPSFQDEAMSPLQKRRKQWSQRPGLLGALGRVVCCVCCSPNSGKPRPTKAGSQAES
mmetsp:Transcript_26736/g.58123  ORF Transcript_26736/g.58123 Transcript_26736/m.58123 type:complete len:167 (-) Transcript_26736:472-972(-)